MRRCFSSLVCMGLGMILLSHGANATEEKAKATTQEKVQAEEKSKNYYKKWLDEDVFYLITDEEKSVFQKLTTDAERDQFIEQFWLRRDPDPRSSENEFKDEHYRRIIYANENFTSGIPGWKTDRGMIYIKFGAPTHVEDYTYGSSYERPAWEGGGGTKVFPTQIWEYRHIEGLGDDVELEFVDTMGGNLYELQTDSNKKDLLLHSTMNGKTIAEMYGKARQIDRVSGRRNAGDGLDPYTHQREKDRPFAKYELLGNVNKAPVIQYKDLQTIVTSKITFDMMPFDVRADYFKISEAQTLVPVTIQVKNQDISFQELTFGYGRGLLHVYGLVSTMSGRFIQEFEDDIERTVRMLELPQLRGEPSRYQKLLLLAAGNYKLSLVVKDIHSGRIGTLDLRLSVPSFPKETMQTSTLILSNTISENRDGSRNVGPFVLGDLKVIPGVTKQFRVSSPLWVYIQLYNMALDPARNLPNVTWTCVVVKGGKEVYKLSDPKGDSCQYISGDRVVIRNKLPAARLGEGKYQLKITIEDLVGKGRLEREEQFEIIL